MEVVHVSHSRNVRFVYAPGEPPQTGSDGLPVPPAALRAQYNYDTDEAYVANGRREADLFDRLIREHGAGGGHLLDFGCSSGRLLRHFAGRDGRYTGLYGVDIDNPHIEWALALPAEFKMVPITSMPNLPFEDRSFDVVISRSVFTHIRDLAVMALMELRRVLKPGGLGLITVLDDDTWQHYAEHPEYFARHTYFFKVGLSHDLFSGGGIPGDYLVQGFDPHSMVFYRRAYLNRVWGRFLDVLDTRCCPEFSHQSVVIMKKGD